MKAINIILDTTDPQNPIFIEIEDDDGKSIKIGTSATYDTKFDSSTKETSIRITIDDILELSELGLTMDDLLSFSEDYRVQV